MSANPQIIIGATAVDKASGVLRSLDQQVLGTTSKIERSNDMLSSSTEKSAQRVKRNYANIAASVASLGAGIVSFTTSFSNLEKAQYRVNQASVTLERSQQKLEKMQASGKFTAEQLALQQEDVAVKTHQLKIAQTDASDTMLNFYAQMPTQLISFGTSTALAYQAITGKTLTATAAMKGLRTAMNFMAAHPIVLVITGAAIGATLLATHWREVSGAFEHAGKVIHEFVTQYFKPLGDVITWAIDGLNALGANIKTKVVPAYAEATETTGEFANETINAGTAIAKTARQVDTYIGYLQDLQQDTAKSTRENMWLIESLDKETAALVKNRFEIELVADFLKDQQRELQRTREENFNLVASINGVDQALLALRDGSLTQIADKLRNVKDEANEASKAIDNRNKKARGGNLEDRARAAFGDIGDFVNNGGHSTFIKKHARGGIIDEPTLMLGMRTGQLGLAGEAGKETIVPGIGGPRPVNIEIEQHKTTFGDVLDAIIVNGAVVYRAGDGPGHKVVKMRT